MVRYMRENNGQDTMINESKIIHVIQHFGPRKNNNYEIDL